MPTRVSSLPTDKRGFPVPWVSCWHNGEDQEPMRVVTVNTHLMRVENLPAADCLHVAGVGVPDLGSLCPGNQLKGMLDRLCDVCGDEIEPGPIFFLGAYNVLGGAVGFRECGVHRECALYAAQVCPGLITATPRKQVSVFESTDYDLQPEFIYMDGDELTTTKFASFDDPWIMARLALNQRMVLLAAYARPHNPTITPLSRWVSLQLNGSTV